MAISEHSVPGSLAELKTVPASSVSKEESFTSPKTESIKTQRVYQLIFEKIRDSIFNGDLKPGEKLPPERILAKRFQVSRTTIREALRVLELQGIIEIRSHEGSFIRPVETQTLIDDMASAIIKAEDSMVFEMLEVRRVIETECAALAAVRGASPNLIKIRAALDDMSKSESDEELGLLADLNFHYAVAEAANSPILFDLMKILVSRMKDTIRATRRYRFAQPYKFEQTLNDHQEIYFAISAHDPDRARKLMTKHLVDIREEIARMQLDGERPKESSASGEP